MSQRCVLFPEGPGYELVAQLATTGASKVYLVRSIKDKKLYVRKESLPRFLDSSQTIQSEDVRNGQRVQGLDCVSKLVGFTEYHGQTEDSMHFFVTATLWEYCSGKTMDEVVSLLDPNTKELPLSCVWALLEQMLAITLEVLRKGVVNVDAHGGNWIVHQATPSAGPQLVLIDWGQAVCRPAEHCPGKDSYEHRANCGDCSWWLESNRCLKLFVVDHIRSLAKSFCQVTTDFSQQMLQLNQCSPRAFASGEQWLARMNELCRNVKKKRESFPIAQTTNSKHDQLTTNTSTGQLSLEQALTEIDVSTCYLTDVEVVHLWKIARFDPRTSRILSMEQRPDPYNETAYADMTDQESLSSEWRQSHQDMRSLLRRFDAEDKVKQDLTQSHNTAF